MKSNSVRAAWIALLSIVLSLSMVGIAVLAAGTGDAQAESAHFDYVKAADASPVPPDPLAVCAFAHADGAQHAAYLVDSVAKLKWLFDDARTAEELSRCYVLKLSDALDITDWSDTGIGSTSVPFTGHLYGGGAAIRYRFTASAAAAGADGGLGLFAAIQGTAEESARVSDLELSAETTQSLTIAAVGALTSGLSNAVIERVNVRQSCPQTYRVTDATGIFGSTPYYGARDMAGIAASMNAATTVRDCTVTLLPQMRNGAAAPEASAVGYAGIVGTNSGGTIDRCRFFYEAGPGTMISSGGITVNNFGDITNCFVSIQETGLAMRASSGITDVHDNGAIRDCAVELNADSVWDDSGDYTLTAGIASFVGYYGTADAGGLDGDTEITGCTVTGAGLHTHGASGALVSNVAMSAGRSVLIENCHSTLAKIVDTKLGMVGGLVGDVNVNGEFTMRDCTTTTDIEVVNNNAGGLIANVQHKGTGSFTIENCHSYAAAVTATVTTGNTCSNIAGAIGRILGTAEHAATNTSIEDCSASAAITYNGTGACYGVGGFIGHINYLSEDAAAGKPTFSGCRAYGSIVNNNAGDGSAGFIGYVSNCQNVAFRDCSASGGVTVTTGGRYGAGGFAGYVYANEALTFADCTAEGKVEFDNFFYQGGFVGYVTAADVTIRTTVNVVFTGCKAYGDVSCLPNAVNGAQSGGFAGTIETSSRFENCSAAGEVVVYSRGGGFFGILTGIPAGGKVDFINCSASGDVYGSGDSYIAGFAGHVWGCDPSVRVTFDHCTAYGSAIERSHATSVGGYGGFIGTIYNSNVYFVDCTAYGDAIGYTAGGFIAYITGKVQVECQRCTAYGDAIDRAPDDGKSYNSQAGGFLGYAESPGNPLTLTNCKSYGNVEASTDDCGGFLGPFRMKATVTNCHSYARSVYGKNYSAGFAGVYTDGGVGSTFKGCTYTPAHLSFFLFFGSGAEAVKDQFTKDAACGPGDTAYTEDTVPCTNVSCAVAASGTNVDISFTNVKFLTDTVREISVSTDGGKYFTQLVYGGKTLLPVTVNGAALAIGSTVSVTDGTNFNLLYATNAYPGNANIVVRIEFTKGFSKSYSWT